MRTVFHGPTRLIVGCVFTLWLFFTPVQAQTSESTASLRGVVTNASGGAALRKAYVRLSPPIGSKGSESFTAVTNDQGAFVIENIAPGDYHLDIECTGFLDTRYGGGSPFDGHSILKLSPGDKLTGIEIKMTPQAVLSGRVLDKDGDPWPRAYIQVLRAVWKKGKRTLEGVNSSSFSDVDDRGEFRMAGLAPGRYYVLAKPEDQWEREHRPPAARQQPTWYPSSPDVESSTPVILAAGQQSPESKSDCGAAPQARLFASSERQRGWKRSPHLAAIRDGFSAALELKGTPRRWTAHKTFPHVCRLTGPSKSAGCPVGATIFELRRGFPPPRWALLLSRLMTAMWTGCRFNFTRRKLST